MHGQLQLSGRAHTSSLMHASASAPKRSAQASPRCMDDTRQVLQLPTARTPTASTSSQFPTSQPWPLSRSLTFAPDTLHHSRR